MNVGRGGVRRAGERKWRESRCYSRMVLRRHGGEHKAGMACEKMRIRVRRDSIDGRRGKESSPTAGEEPVKE